MTPSTPSAGVSRRALFTLAGSGIALASVAAVWRSRSSGAEAAPAPDDAPITYADYNGWMVTPDEKAALAAAGLPAATPAAPRS
jgi:hypothetical protein